MTVLATQDESALLFEYGGGRGPWLGHAKDLGAEVIRFMVYSYALNERGWDFLDRAVDETRAAGFQVYLTITGNPQWNDSGPVKLRDPDPALFGALVGAVVGRYKGRVLRYGVGNEPNHEGFMQVSHGDPADHYAKLYRAGYEAALDAWPAARLNYGELSGKAGALTFLRRATRHGAKAHGFAWHPYQFNSHPRVPRIAPGHAGIGNLPLVKKTMKDLARQHRLETPDRHPLPLYITEFGYFPKPWKYGQTEATRAKWSAAAFKRAEAYDVRWFLYYHLRETSLGVNWNTGIVKPDGKRDPAFNALRNAAR